MILFICGLIHLKGTFHNPTFSLFGSWMTKTRSQKKKEPRLSLA